MKLEVVWLLAHLHIICRLVLDFFDGCVRLVQGGVVRQLVQQVPVGCGQLRLLLHSHLQFKGQILIFEEQQFPKFFTSHIYLLGEIFSGHKYRAENHDKLTIFSYRPGIWSVGFWEA